MKIGTRVFSGEALEARLCAMLDYILSDPVMEQASLSAGFGRKYIWTALKRSGSGDPRYLVRWPDRDSDDEKIQFADAVVLARNMWRVKFDGNLRSAVDTGIPRVVLDQNHEVVYEKDSALLAEYGGDTEDARKRADDDFIFDYPYKHRKNEAGKFERIPLVVFDPAPGSLRLHASRSLLPDWNPSEHRSVTTSSSSGVLTIGRPAYARDVADTPLRRDLQQRLADLRAKGPANPLPLDANGRRTIPHLGTSAAALNDPPENGADMPPDKPPAPRPVRMSGGERTGAGKPWPGGFSATTGKPS